MATYVTSTSALSSSTTTSTSLQDKLTLTLTAAQQAASAVYFVIAYAEVAASVAGNRINLKLVNTTGSVTYQDLAPAPALSTYNDNLGQMMVGVFTAAGTPVDNTFKVQYSSDTGNEVRIQNVTLLILKKGSEDQYDETTGKYDATTSYAAIASKTFTPGSSGDYLVIGCCEALASANARPATRITIASSLVTGMVDASDTPTASARHALSLSWFVNLAASSQTITFDLKGDDATADIYNRRLLVIRLGDLPAYWSNTNSTLDSTLPTSFEAKVTLTQTLPAVPIWAIATVPGRTSSTATVNITTALRTGGTERVSGATRPRALFGNECTDTMTLAYLFTGSGSSTTVDAGWYSASSISGNIQYASLIVLQLESSGITGTASGTIGTITGTSAGAVDVAGAASGTIGTIAGTTAGTVDISGAASGSIGAITGTATGTAVSEIIGEASGTIGTITGSAAGAVDVSGSASGEIGTITGASVGASSISGTASDTIGEIAGSSSGAIAITGESSYEPLIGGTSAGTVDVQGSATGTIGEITGTAAGNTTGSVNGAASGTIGDIDGTAAGVVVVAGISSGSIGEIAGIGAATVTISGQSSVTIGTITSTSAGAVAISGSASASIGTIAGTASGIQGSVAALDFDVSTVLWTFGRRAIAMGPNYTVDMGPRYTARRT